MKKSTSIIIAFILAFFISSSINAQTAAINSKKSTEKECVDKQEKECTTTNKGFNFTKKSSSKGCCKAESNKANAQKASCSSKAEKASCDSKAKKASCDSKSVKKQSCCSKTAKASNRDAAAKVRQAIAKGEITPEQGNARLARLQNNKK
tara:strand:+ start:425 stop:874 length:450 start_codon:yes stop_codon:yes gene_type:complete